MLRDEDIELVKSQVNMRMLAEHFGIQVNRTGQALCPFHSDKRPSMKVHSGYLYHDGYYCWACGAGGTIFNFAMEYCNLEFKEAVRYIANVFGIQITDEAQMSQDERNRIHRLIREREREDDVRNLQIQLLILISEKIKFYEEIKRQSEPFGGLFCWMSNQLVVLGAKWERLYEELYG